MKNHFIKNITLENFKCFQKLHIEGMENVNLIGGKNNVGKTAFLEAVELLVSPNETYDLAVNIYNLLTRRQRNQDSTDFILDFILIVESENDKYFIESLKEFLNIYEVNIDTPICTIDDYECLNGLSKAKLEAK